MKRQYTEFTCDGCLDKVREAAYHLPKGWTSVDVKRGDARGFDNGEEVNFCAECWDAGKPPTKRDDIPLTIRKLFNWAFKEADKNGTPDETAKGD